VLRLFFLFSYRQYAWRVSEFLPSKHQLGSKSNTDNGLVKVLKFDNDDDGEDAAGGRLGHLLEMRNEDGVLVVVSRWFGGVLLGSKRFVHITNVARDLLVHVHATYPEEFLTAGD
jgi:Uncharacterized protein family UPF0029